jgi:hypothetical protein
MTPSGIETNRAKIMAAAASCRLTGKRSASRPVTRSLRRIERPRSPVATLAIHNPYCSGSERSRLNSARIAAAASCEVCMPSMIWTGSPGVARVMRKVISETTTRTSGTWISLRPR